MQLSKIIPNQSNQKKRKQHEPRTDYFVPSEDYLGKTKRCKCRNANLLWLAAFQNVIIWRNIPRKKRWRRVAASWRLLYGDNGLSAASASREFVLRSLWHARHGLQSINLAQQKQRADFERGRNGRRFAHRVANKRNTVAEFQHNCFAELKRRFGVDERYQITIRIEWELRFWP